MHRRDTLFTMAALIALGPSAARAEAGEALADVGRLSASLDGRAGEWGLRAAASGWRPLPRGRRILLLARPSKGGDGQARLRLAFDLIERSMIAETARAEMRYSPSPLGTPYEAREPEIEVRVHDVTGADEAVMTLAGAVEARLSATEALGLGAVGEGLGAAGGGLGAASGLFGGDTREAPPIRIRGRFEARLERAG